MVDESNDAPSTSANITKRNPKRRPNSPNEENPLASNKQRKPEVRNMSVESESSKVVERVLENAAAARSKMSTANCFKTSNPFMLLKENLVLQIPLQEVAVLLETAHTLYSCRVDRTLNEARQVMSELQRGLFNTGEGVSIVPAADLDAEGEEGAEGRKRKKRDDPTAAQIGMALQDGVDSGDDAEDGELDADERILRNLARKMAQIDQVLMNDEIETVEWLPNDNLDEKIAQLIKYREAKNTNRQINSLQPNVGENIDLPPNDSDVLRMNVFYQKAVRGAADNMSNFQMLQNNGVYSHDGRCLFLHQRMVDEDSQVYPRSSEITADFVRPFRDLVSNAMRRVPVLVERGLMPFWKERPRLGQFIISRGASNRIEAGGMDSLLSSATKNPDLNATVLADMTVAMRAPRTNRIEPAAVDTSPEMDSTTFHQEPPVVTLDDEDDTIINNPNLRAALEAHAKEPELPPFDSILMPNELDPVTQVKFPDDVQEFRTEELETLLKQKVERYESGDSIKRIWSRGIYADEWQEDNSVVNQETSYMQSCKIEAYVKMLDHLTNAEVVLMRVHKEHFIDLEKEYQRKLGADESSAKQWKVLPVGKHFFLREPDSYPKIFPADPHQNIDEENIADSQNGDVPAFDINNVDNVDLEMNISRLDEEVEAADNAIQIDNFIDVAGVRAEREAQEERERLAILTGGTNDEDEFSPNNSFHADVDEDVPEIANYIDPNDELRPEAERELKTIGKEDDSHWKGNELVKKLDAKKRGEKEKKERKPRKKIGHEDYSSYWLPSTVEDQVEKISVNRCQKAKNLATLFRENENFYLDEIPKNKKPHMAFEFESLGRSGLLFGNQRGAVRFERTAAGKRVQQKKKRGDATDELYIEDVRPSTSTNDFEALDWILSFNNFRVFYQEHQREREAKNQDRPENFSDFEPDYDALGDDLRFEDDDEAQLALSRKRQETMSVLVGDDLQRYKNIIRDTETMKLQMRRMQDNYSDDSSDDELTEVMGKRRNLKVKTLDAAKHKKVIAEVVSSLTFSAPNMRLLLDGEEQNSEERPQSALSTHESEQNSPSKQKDLLSTVFELKTDSPTTVDKETLWNALTDLPEYVEEDAMKNLAADATKANDAFVQNDPSKRIRVKGHHTFKSTLVCMPHRMLENVEPAALLNFSLHVCNENGLRLVQDRTKKDWMTDFLILNGNDPLPTDCGIGVTDIPESEREFWESTNDPFAHPISESGETKPFKNLRFDDTPSASQRANDDDRKKHANRRLFVDNDGSLEAVQEADENGRQEDEGEERTDMEANVEAEAEVDIDAALEAAAGGDN